MVEPMGWIGDYGMSGKEGNRMSDYWLSDERIITHPIFPYSFIHRRYELITRYSLFFSEIYKYQIKTISSNNY